MKIFTFFDFLVFFKKLCLFIIILMCANVTKAQTTTITSGSTTQASAIPANNAIIINAGGTLSMDVAKTFASITTANTGTSTISGTGALTVTGAVLIVSGNALSLNPACTSGSLTTNWTSTTASTLTGSGTITTGAFTIDGGTGGSNNGLFSIGANATVICTSINQVAGNKQHNIDLSGTLKNSGTIANIDNITCNSGSTFEYNGAAQTVFPTTYYTLILSGSGAKTISTTSTINTLLSMEGTATATAAPTYTTATAALQYNTATSRTVGAEWITPFVALGGVIIKNTGTITLDAAKQFGNNTNAPLNINSGATLSTSASNFGLTFHGNFINAGTLTAGSSPITIAGTVAAHNIGTFTTTGTVSLTKTAGTATFTGNIGGTDLTINGSGGTLNLGTGLTHTFTGNWTRTTGTLNGGSSLLKIGGSVSGTAGTFTAGTGTVEWNASGAQTIADVTYYNLTTSGNNTKTLNGATTVSNTLTIGASTTLDENTRTMTIPGGASVVVNGTLDFTSSTGLMQSGTSGTSTLTMGSTGTIRTLDPLGIGPVANASLVTQAGGAWTTSSIASNGTIEYYINTATGVITDIDYNNLTISGTSFAKTWTPGATRTVAGTVTVAGGFTLSGSPTINVGGNWTNSGGTFTPGSSTINFNSTTAAQAINGTAASQSFNNIIVNKSGRTLSVGGSTTTLSAAGTVTLTAGTFDAGTATAINLTGNGGNWTNNGGTFTPGSSTITFSNTSGGQAINGSAASQSFNSITVNKSGQTLSVGGSTTTLNAGGTVTLTAGTFDAGTASAINLTGSGGNWTNNGGTFTPGSGTVTFNNTSGAQAINGSAASQSFNNITINKSGQALSVAGSTTTLNSSGTVTLTAGTFDAGTASAINLTANGGNWTNNGGTFTPGSGTVTFNNTSGGQAINGSASSQTFNNITVVKSAQTLSIGSTSANVTLNGTLTLTSGSFGVGSNTLTLSGPYIAGTVNNLTTTSSSNLVFNCTGTGPFTLPNFTAINNLTTNSSGQTYNLNSNPAPSGSLTISAGTLNLGSNTIDRSTSGGTLTVSNGATLKIGSTNTIPNNYSTHSIGATSTIEYSGSNQSIGTLNSSQAYGHLTMSGTGTKTLNGDISVAGNWLRNSGPDFNNNDKIVTFSGSAAATLKAPESLSKDANGGFGGETFAFLVLNKGALGNALKILSNVTITKTITLTRGTLDMDTSDVVLVSNATNTADLAAVNTSNADISYTSTGRFIPQRYIGNTSTVRTWRFLTAPLQASDPLTINDAWQEGQVNPNVNTPNATNPWPGFGTHITGAGSVYDATKGFDQGTGNNGYSIEYFDNTTGTTKLSYPANTKSTALMSQLGWQIFIRGDRSFVIGSQTTPSASTILEPKGKINIGTVTSTIVANRTNVVGNPYPCQINMAGVSIGGFTQQDFKLWDPKAYTNYSNTGKYIFFNWNGAGYDVNNGPTTTWLYPGTVESSEAFLTYNTVAGTSVVFHESDKVAGTSTLNGIQSRPVAGNRPTGNPYAKFQADLQFYDNTNQVYNNISGANIYFNPGFNSTVVAGEDNISPVGSATGEIRIQKNGFQLSTDREPLLSADDTVHLYISTLSHSKHRLVLSTKYFVPNASAVLIDQYLNTTTPLVISNTDSVFYEFDINSNAANQPDRFMIAFRPIISLPVKFNNVKATQQQAAIAVEWQMENEINVKNYYVERSADGIHFTKVADKVAINSSAIYNWLDVSPNNGNNYYRIRLVDQSGASTYSEIIKVKIGNKEITINIVNNPIVNNTINLQFNNQQSGIYKVRLFNQSGQTIESKEISGTGNSWGESFLVSSSLSKGLYNLEILTPSNKKLIKKVIVQ